MGARRWWMQRRFGLLLHANLASVPAWAPIGQDAPWYRAHVDNDVCDVLLHPSPLAETLVHHRDRWAHIEHYDDFFPFLTFDEFDADAWAGLARDAGMGYAVMVAKHHDGMCWWDAPNTDRTVLHDGPARNVLGEFATACERADLTFGTYYSLLDWGDPRYPDRSYVDDVVHPHILDLVERYGSRILWGDGHWGAGGDHWRSDELIAAARRIDPDIVVNDRWWATEPGITTYQYELPDGIATEPWELVRGLGGSLGYNRAERADHLLTPARLVALLTEVVAKRGHLLLSVGADASGRIPQLHADRIRTTGRWVRQHGDLIDRGTPWTEWGDDETRYLVLDDDLIAIDVGGHGRFDALGRDAGRVTTIETFDRTTVGFEQTDSGLRLARPHRPIDDMPSAYRVSIEEPPPAPIELFPAAAPEPIELAGAIGDARRGEIVQLGEGTYVGPARVPDGVTVRGLGPHRTTIDGLESCAVVVGADARLEHCTVVGGGRRIVWLPKPVVRLAGARASILGCRVAGHVDVATDGARITSCVATGVTAGAVERVTLSRSTFRGMQWDCAVDITGGSGHLIESCEFSDVLAAIRLTDTVGAHIRGNRIAARWWGIHLIDTDGTVVIGNAIESTMRAIDVDGGTLAEVTGNAVLDGDSGCVLQRGASDIELAGNRWERCRIGLLAWDAGSIRHRDNAAVDLLDTDAAVTIGP
jgi:alpha-L-fucosidase